MRFDRSDKAPRTGWVNSPPGLITTPKKQNMKLAELIKELGYIRCDTPEELAACRAILNAAGHLPTEDILAPIPCILSMYGHRYTIEPKDVRTGDLPVIRASDFIASNTTQPEPVKTPTEVTLIDYFAAKAMQGLLLMPPGYLEQYYPSHTEGPNYAGIACDSYKIAAAMMEARKKHIS